jgi:hypothetical protein
VVHFQVPSEALDPTRFQGVSSEPPGRARRRELDLESLPPGYVLGQGQGRGQRVDSGRGLENRLERQGATGGPASVPNLDRDRLGEGRLLQRAQGREFVDAGIIHLNVGIPGENAERARAKPGSPVHDCDSHEPGDPGLDPPRESAALGSHVEHGSRPVGEKPPHLRVERDRFGVRSRAGPRDSRCRRWPGRGHECRRRSHGRPPIPEVVPEFSEIPGVPALQTPQAVGLDQGHQVAARVGSAARFVRDRGGARFRRGRSYPPPAGIRGGNTRPRLPIPTAGAHGAPCRRGEGPGRARRQRSSPARAPPTRCGSRGPAPPAPARC